MVAFGHLPLDAIHVRIILCIARRSVGIFKGSIDRHLQALRGFCVAQALQPLTRRSEAELVEGFLRATRKIPAHNKRHMSWAHGSKEAVMDEISATITKQVSALMFLVPQN